MKFKEDKEVELHTLNYAARAKATFGVDGVDSDGSPEILLEIDSQYMEASDIKELRAWLKKIEKALLVKSGDES